MKKILLIITMTLTLFTVFVQPKDVSAVNITVNISALTDTVMTTLLNDLKTRVPNWFTDYKYFVYSGVNNSPRYLLLVPNTASSKFILWSETVDSDSDLDAILFTAYCSTASPCYRYTYTVTGAYQAVTSYTSNIIDSNYSTLPLHYTNIYQQVKRWWWDGSEYIPIDWNMDDYNGGIPKISSTVLNNVGATNTATTAGDLQIIEQLQLTGNMFLDGFITLANVFIGAINGLVVNMIEQFASTIVFIGNIGSSLQNLSVNLMPTGFSAVLSYIGSIFGGTGGLNFLGAIYDIVVGFIPALLYIITSIANLVFTSGQVILSSFSDTLWLVVSNVSQMLTWFPIQLGSFFTMVITLFAFSTIIRIAWYVITLGAVK